MTAVAAAILVSIAVLVAIACCIGLLVVRSPYDQLHLTGPLSSVTPALIALAIAIDEGPLSAQGIKAVLVAGLVIGLNPVLVHAAARAARVREHGRWRLLPAERGAGPR